MGKYTPSTHKYWIEIILSEASDELTAWERDFMNKMQTRIENGWDLTVKEEKKLQEIFDIRITKDIDPLI